MSKDEIHLDLLVKALASERDIRNQLGSFSHLIDSQRWDDAGMVFAEDVVFDYGPDDSGHGLEALKATFAKYLGRAISTQHLIGSVVISVDGDRAHSTAYVQARHARHGGECTDVFDTNGEYCDDWQRLNGLWKISERRARWTMWSGAPEILAIDGSSLPTNQEGN